MTRHWITTEEKAEIETPFGPVKLVPINFERVRVEAGTPTNVEPRTPLTVDGGDVHVQGMLFRGTERGPENDGEGWTLMQTRHDITKHVKRSQHLSVRRDEDPHADVDANVKREICDAVVAAVNEWSEETQFIHGLFDGDQQAGAVYDRATYTKIAADLLERLEYPIELESAE